jgi:serine/threonine protein kinase
MSDTIPMGNSDPARKAEAGVSDSARACPDCGETFTGPFHALCPKSDKTVRESQLTPAPSTAVLQPPSSRRSFDALPDEAAPWAQDSTRQVHHYILVKQIGKGGMGTVWKAWDRKLNRWVAIKFLLAEEDRGIDRFQREARIAAGLRHPHIAAIYEVGEAPSTRPGGGTMHFLVMEFIDGQTLAAVNLPRRALIEIFLNVARALDVAHKSGIIHRDLKPLNIMVTHDGWPYVMDFGLAKAAGADSSLSQSGDVMGTPAYMSPEQAEGRLSDLDARSDIYSLGATMYAVLMGRPPHTGQSSLEIIRKVVNEPVAPPRSVQPDFPLEVQAVLMKALSKNKEARYASAAEMANELAYYLEVSRAPAPNPAAAPRAPLPPEPPIPIGAPEPPKSRKGAAALVVVLLAAGIAGWFAFQRKPAVPDRPPTPPSDQAVVKVPPPQPPKPEPPVVHPEKGVFTLSVSVHPYAELVRISRDGTPLDLGGRFSPFVEPGLRIGSYDVVLRHPKLGEKTVKLSEGSLKPGKTVVIWGRMENPSLQVTESP